MLVNSSHIITGRWQRLTTAVAISLSALTLSGCVIAHTPHKSNVQYGYVKSSPTKTVTTTTTRYETAPVAISEEDEMVAVLDSALAPIALYPDSLLEHIFAAVTQPVDLIQAQAFIEQHGEHDPDELLSLAQDKPWDPSVIALLPFADVIANLTEDLEYLEYLGDVVEGDYSLVATRLAYLRQQAQNSGNLTSDEYVKVIEKETKIYIESAQPEVVFVPTYNPAYVYGSWWHGYQPRKWTYRHIKRHGYRQYHHSPRLGVHVSHGNVSINWNPFRYVRHNYWRDHYNIKQRHQLFSRRLHASHRAHNVHRSQQWGSGKRWDRKHWDKKRDNHKRGNDKGTHNNRRGDYRVDRSNDKKWNNNRRGNNQHVINNTSRQMDARNIRTNPVKNSPVKQPPKRPTMRPTLKDRALSNNATKNVTTKTVKTRTVTTRPTHSQASTKRTASTKATTGRNTTRATPVKLPPKQVSVKRVPVKDRVVRNSER